MKAITLRNIPDKLAELIETEASESGLSLNKTVIKLLEKALKLDQEVPRLHRDLDDLAGSWSQEEADLFDEALRQQRQIDPEVWE